MTLETLSDIRVEAKRGVLFETPIVQASFKNADSLLNELDAAVRQRLADDSEGVQRSNIGGWHSDTFMTQWGGDAARALTDKAITIARRLSSFGEKSHDDFNWTTQMWANVSGPGASNHMHVHPGNLWSAVFYLDMGGAEEDPEVGGAFYFEDPRFPVAVMHNTAFRFVGQDGQPQSWQPEIRPKRGDLLMFPAWLRHGVRPYTGDKERVSIALNVDATLK
ncbi:MAG: 2OG-Fe(II) oxygenase family protein [Pseudomonadota bacterium]